VTNNKSRKIKPPAIALLIFGVLTEILGVLITILGVLHFVDKNRPPIPSNSDERLGYIVGGVVIYGIALISIFAAPYIVLGAVNMMKSRKYASARYAALVAMVPFSSCLFIVGLPIGVWALTTLSKPEVRDNFMDQIDGPETTPVNEEMSKE
jgi:cbb3-type cytochrome oxidase subunit 1